MNSVSHLLRNMEAVIVEGIATDNARDDAREILTYLIDVPRSWPAFNADASVAPDIAASAMTAAAKRGKGAPIQYCAGLAAFRHLTLHVDERVLIPRPETELLVDHVLARAKTGIALDIGTGSGAIALALASEGEFTKVIATDISMDALSVARMNAARHANVLNTTVEFMHGNGVRPVSHVRANVLVSNPPYIAFSEIELLDDGVRNWEPHIALTAADNGMAVIAELIGGSADVLLSGGLLALEVDCTRAGLAAELAATDGRYCDISVLADLTGRDRFVFAYKI